MAEIQSPNIVPEFRAPSDAPKGAPVQQDDSEVTMVLDLLDQGKKIKDEQTADWNTRWDFFNDKQWGQNRPKNRSDATLNVIKTTIQTKLPILTDNRPGFNVLPEEPSDFAFAEVLGQLVSSWWDKYGLDETVLEALMDSMIYDAGICKIVWNPELEEGIGNIEVTVIDPRDITVPETARDFDKECPWMIQTMQKSVGELKRKFPQFAAQITPDSEGTGAKEGQANAASTAITLVSPVDQKSKLDPKASPTGANSDRQTCLVAECWIDDEALVEYEEENEDGTTTAGYKKEFPNGKLITVLVNKKICLQSIENPYRHGKKPFVRFVDTILPRKFWGQGEAQPLMSIQKVINKVLANIIDTMNFSANPAWIIGKGSGVDTTKLTNTYGVIIQPTDVNQVRRDQPPSVPGYIMSLYEMVVRAAETISGVHDVTQGKQPGGITAASAISTLQESAQTRIRLQERNLQSSLGQMGRMVIALMMQYYNQPRVARLTNDNQTWPDYFEFFVEDLPDGQVQYSKKGYKFNESENKYVPDEQYTQGQPTKGVFDVKVLSGTSLPFAKSQRSNVAMKLMELGVIDAPELLKTLEWPNREEVLNRKAKEAQAAAQQPQPPQGA